MEGDHPPEAIFPTNSRLVLSIREASIKSNSSDSDIERGGRLSDSRSKTDHNETLSQLEGLRIIDSQSVLVADEEDTVAVTTTLLEAPSKHHRRRIDHATWLKKKKEQEAAKKTRKEKKCKAESEPPLADDLELIELLSREGTENGGRDQKAWKLWVARKQLQIEQRQQEQAQMQRQMQHLEQQKRQKAQLKFAEWYEKKELERKGNKQVRTNSKEQQLRKEGQERSKKLNYSLKWDEWYKNKCQQMLPKKFTHQEYPEPTWVNPEPWVT